MSTRIWLQRAYDEPTHNDGYRVLVDRIWPRGVSKDDLHIDAWEKDVAPSDALRTWFGHDPERWDEFQQRYRDELDSDTAQEILDRLADRIASGRITLVYGAKDEEHNQAVVLRDVLEERTG